MFSSKDLGSGCENFPCRIFSSFEISLNDEDVSQVAETLDRVQIRRAKYGAFMFEAFLMNGRCLSIIALVYLNY